MPIWINHSVQYNKGMENANDSKGNRHTLNNGSFLYSNKWSSFI